MSKRSAGITGITTVLLVLVVASSAYGWAKGQCTTAPTGHCYALAFHEQQFLASITSYDTNVAEVPEWNVACTYPENPRFNSQEQWVSFPGKLGSWIETGTMAGDCYNATSIFYFAAAYTPSRGWWRFFQHPIHPLVMNTYNATLLFDQNINGNWLVYWGCNAGSYEWCYQATVEHWPVWGGYTESGTEINSEVEPQDAGRQGVWWSNGTVWHNWASSTNWVSCNAPCINMLPNPESSAPGMIEWGTAPGANTRVQREEASQPDLSKGTELVIQESPAGTLKAAGAIPRGQKVPTGKYKALVRYKGTNVIDKEYVGNSLKDAQSLEHWPNGGAQGPSLP